MSKNIRTVVAVLAFAFAMLNISISAQAQTDRALAYQAEKCPPNSKCGFYFGEDGYRTNVQISNGATALFVKWGIRTQNEGTKLVWVTPKCAGDISRCANIDLTGRKRGEVVPMEDLNKTVKITASGTNAVKMSFVEFDDDEGSFTLVDGKPPADMPKIKRSN